MLFAIHSSKPSWPSRRVPVESRCTFAILIIPLIRAKEKDFVLNDRAAETNAREIALQLWLLEVRICFPGCQAELIERNKIIVEELCKRVGLPLVGSRLGYCSNDCARRLLIFSFEVRSRDAEFL